MKAKENKLFEFLSFSPEVKQAFVDHKPILALESTVLTHGLPSPINIDIAHELEQLAREKGAVPATMALLNGVIKIGLTANDIAELGNGRAEKASVRDLAYMIANKKSAGTTVALTAYLAHLVGIHVFATGGIGGVHRGDDLDISADLFEISKTPITIISAGPKAILDIPRTLEVLETYSVPVIGYGTTTVPAFYSRTSKYNIPFTINTLHDMTCMIKTHRYLQPNTGILIMNPISSVDEIPETVIEPVILKALEKAKLLGIKGKDTTPFLLSELHQITDGLSLKANISLLKNNVALGATLAKSLQHT